MAQSPAAPITVALVLFIFAVVGGPLAGAADPAPVALPTCAWVVDLAIDRSTCVASPNGQASQGPTCSVDPTASAVSCAADGVDVNVHFDCRSNADANCARVALFSVGEATDPKEPIVNTPSYWLLRCEIGSIIVPLLSTDGECLYGTKRGEALVVNERAIMGPDGVPMGQLLAFVDIGTCTSTETALVLGVGLASAPVLYPCYGLTLTGEEE